MHLAVDGRRLIREPHTIELQGPEPEASLTADRRPFVRPPHRYTTFVCTWGSEYSYQDVLRELDRIRANRGLHAVTFEIYNGQFLTVNAYMGEARPTHVKRTPCGTIITSSFSIPFIQVDTPTWLVPLRFPLRGIIAVADAAASIEAPAAGRILAVDGWIRDLGAGAGQTRVQVSNGATDYLSTRGDFVNALPAVYQMQNAVLGTSLDFARGDQIDIDVDDIPAGGLSKDALITVWTWCYTP